MTNHFKGLLGLAAVLWVSGCASGPSRECSGPQQPPPPPPPPCGCGCDKSGFGSGSNGPMQEGEPGVASSFGPHAGGPGRHHLPPPEAFEACQGKKVDDVCKVQRGSWEMTGTCRGPKGPEQGDASKAESDEHLACVPEHPKGSAEGARDSVPPNQVKPKN
jgi:hypothetical protein